MKNKFLPLFILTTVILFGCGKNEQTVAQNPTAGSEAAATRVDAATPAIQKDEAYNSVRAKMLAAGWKPFTTDQSDCKDKDSADNFPACKETPEMEACAGTGMGQCIFNWNDGERIAAIATYGDEKLFHSIAVNYLQTKNEPQQATPQPTVNAANTSNLSNESISSLTARIGKDAYIAKCGVTTYAFIGGYVFNAIYQNGRDAFVADHATPYKKDGLVAKWVFRFTADDSSIEEFHFDSGIENSKFLGETKRNQCEILQKNIQYLETSAAGDAKANAALAAAPSDKKEACKGQCYVAAGNCKIYETNKKTWDQCGAEADVCVSKCN